MKIFIAGLTLVIVLILTAGASAQKSRAPILVSKSKFAKVASDFDYSGTSCSPIWDLDSLLKNYPNRIIRDRDTIFYPAVLYFRGNSGDGLVVEDLAKKTCTTYSMRGIQESMNWVDSK